MKKILENWLDKISVTGKNIIELKNSDSYKMILGMLNSCDTPFIGITQNKAASIIEDIDILFINYSNLSDLVHSIEALSENQSIFNSNLEKIKALIEGDSLTITSKAVPVEERGLFEDTCKQTKITPEKMFELLEVSFKNVCNDIKIIIDSVKEAEILSNKTNERYKSLENRANTLNYPISKFDLEELISELKANPLDLHGITKKINLLFSKFELELSNASDEYNYLDLLFNSVDSKIKELNKLTSKSRQIAAENLGQLDAGKTLIKPLDNSHMEFINTWVYDLKKYFKLGKYKPVKIGLTKLNEECILLLGSEKRIFDDNIRVLKG